MVRDIKPEMCIAFLDTKQGCSSKTISAYKNTIEKIAIACSCKFIIDTFNTVKIIGKGGKVSYRPILPQYRSFFRELIKDKQPTERIFDLPKNEKMARLTMSNEIRRITKALDLPQSGKNHEFRKYHCQLAVEHYVSKGWSREKAERFVIQRHLSHSSERQDLKKIYLYS